MSLLLSMAIYVLVGCGEWYLALRRTLACARGEKVLLVSIVFIENLLGLWVLSNFIRTNNWGLALCYSAGASAGALIIAMNSQTKPAKASHSFISHRSRSDADLAVGQTQRLLFDLAEPQKDSDRRALEHARAAVGTFHRIAVKSLRSTQRAFTYAGRERWYHYFPSRRRSEHRIGFSG
jgi:hypothetical protein